MALKPIPPWTVPKEWPGETAFIIAGGPSVTQEQVDRLKGRKVIAIKLSIEKAPWADFLYFADGLWWKTHKATVKAFQGRMVTTADLYGVDRVFKLLKAAPPGLWPTPDGLAVRRTSTSGAINLAFHLGAKRIVLLGLDGKLAPDGRTHHHTPHAMPKKQDYFGEQRKDLDTIVPWLKAREIEIFNTNSESTFRMFPFLSFDAALAQ